MAQVTPFTGVYFHAIDSKSRLTIPRRLRDVIHPREQAYAFYAVAEYDRALYLYTPDVYRESRPQIGADERADPDARAYQRMYYGLTEYLELDRLGRILVPEHLRDLVGIEKNVAIIGADDHIEVWDEPRWREWLAEQFPQRDELARRVTRRRAEAAREDDEAADSDDEASEEAPEPELDN